MLYLKASSGVEALEEYGGHKGMFIKTFAISDKRNKNGWRVTWDSIKRRISTFTVNRRPGIEYVKCEESGCDLDHTEGQTKQEHVRLQEPFRKTTLIDYQLDEPNHTAYFIHQTDDAEFFSKIKAGEIKYVSPSIWPTPGAYEMLGRTERGMPKIDVYDWDGMHSAFVNNPAFGDDAKITAVCEGENCHMRMLTAKQMQAVDLDPIQQVSILVRHRDKLHFVSVDSGTAEKIQALYDSGNKVGEKEITDILKLNNSFSSCSCSANQMDQKEHDEKLAAAKKAAEEQKAEDEKKIKDLESKNKMYAATMKASLVAAVKAMSTKDGDEYIESLKASAKDDDIKIIGEAVEEITSFRAKQEKQEPTESPRILALEAKVAEPMITKMLNARKLNGMGEADLKEYEKSLRAKSLAEIESRYNDFSEQILMKNLSAAEQPEEKVHFAFNGSTNDQGHLGAKSLEEILDEVPA